MSTREDKRTTVSLAAVVWRWAEEMMEAKGYNGNFSAYVADLIRRDQEAHETRQLRKTKYPSHRPEIAIVEDKPKKKSSSSESPDTAYKVLRDMADKIAPPKGSAAGDPPKGKK